MKRIVALLGFALFLLLPTSVAAAECQFVLGFATLRDLVGHDIVGECLENEHYEANGDSVQQTTGGLLVWRKSDNWTAFTDGYRSWINGPNGLEQRLNTELLNWEAENLITRLPWVSDGLEGYYERETIQSLRKLVQASPQVFWELMHKPWIQSETLAVNEAFLPMLYRQIVSMASRDKSTALRVIKMPFMDTLGLGAQTAWEVLNELYDSDPEGQQQLLAHPELRNGITIDKITSIPLLYLDTREPESATAIRALPWIQESPWEVDDLRHLALASQPVFWAWMELLEADRDFSRMLSHITTIARRDERRPCRLPVCHFSRP